MTPTDLRYPHWIQQAKDSSWPHRVIVVDAVEVDESEVDEAGTHYPTLASWTALQLRREDEQYAHHGLTTQDTGADWWRWLTAICDRGRSVAIVSWEATRTWTLLGLWEALERRAIEITPPEWETVDPLVWAARRVDRRGHIAGDSYSLGELRSEIERGEGYLVLSDPPAIARFRLRDSDCWVTWVDLANYGVACPEYATPGRDRCYWISDTWRRYHALCSEYRLGRWCSTAGGQAHYGWRYGYYQGGCYADSEMRVTAAEYDAYYSGRAEPYRLGPVSPAIWYLDIRSCYPSVCRSARLPRRLTDRVERQDHAPAGAAEAAYCCLAAVTICTDTPLYPCRRGGIVIWPIGRYRTVLCGAELALAVSRGHVAAWHWYYRYDMSPILAEYAVALYGARCTYEARGDAEMSSCIKLMLNSLVGRCAQRDRLWRPDSDPDCDILWGEYTARGPDGEPCLYRSLGGHVQRLEIGGPAEDAMPAVAAWVTAAARVRLIEIIEIAGWDHVYYCDTDAVMVDDMGRLRLAEHGMVSQGVWGMLGCRWGPEHVCIHGAKYYTHGGITVCAGMPPDREVELQDGAYYYRASSPAEDVRSHHRPDSAVRRVRYLRSARYRHGVVHPDGRVTPIVLDEE